MTPVQKVQQLKRTCGEFLAQSGADIKRKSGKALAVAFWVGVTTPDGQRLCLKDACELIGVPGTAFYHRTRKGQTIEEASNGRLKEAA